MRPGQIRKLTSLLISFFLLLSPSSPPFALGVPFLTPDLATGNWWSPPLALRCFSFASIGQLSVFSLFLTVSSTCSEYSSVTYRFSFLLLTVGSACFQASIGLLSFSRLWLCAFLVSIGTSGGSGGHVTGAVEWELMCKGLDEDLDDGE